MRPLPCPVPFQTSFTHGTMCQTPEASGFVPESFLPLGKFRAIRPLPGDSRALWESRFLPRLGHAPHATAENPRPLDINKPFTRYRSTRVPLRPQEEPVLTQSARRPFCRRWSAEAAWSLGLEGGSSREWRLHG